MWVDFLNFPWLGFPPCFHQLYSKTWTLISSLYTVKHKSEMAKAVIQPFFFMTVTNCSLLVIKLPGSLNSPPASSLPSPKYLSSSHPKAPNFIIFRQFCAFISTYNPRETSISPQNCTRQTLGKDSDRFVSTVHSVSPWELQSLSWCFDVFSLWNQPYLLHNPRSQWCWGW